jgi:hypothetical protein
MDPIRVVLLIANGVNVTARVFGTIRFIVASIDNDTRPYVLSGARVGLASSNTNSHIQIR